MRTRCEKRAARVAIETESRSYLDAAMTRMARILSPAAVVFADTLVFVTVVGERLPRTFAGDPRYLSPRSGNCIAYHAAPNFTGQAALEASLNPNGDPDDSVLRRTIGLFLGDGDIDPLAAFLSAFNEDYN